MIKNLNRFFVCAALCLLFSANSCTAAMSPYEKKNAAKEEEILNFSTETETIKFKKIDVDNWGDYSISFIVELTHESYSDFNVFAIFLDGDGFEIDRRKLGSCLGDKTIAYNGANATLPLRYSLKGIFTLPPKTYSRIKGVELQFYKQ